MVWFYDMGTRENDFQTILDKAKKISLNGLSKNVFALFEKAGKTVAVVESITGGLLGYYLSLQSGSSQFFRGGVIAYHPFVKINQVGLDPKLLAQKGEVSADVASFLAKNIRKNCLVDIGISAVGFAGPAISKTEKVGLVFLGIATEDKEKSFQFLFDGDRDEIRKKTVEAGLGLLIFELRNIMKGVY